MWPLLVLAVAVVIVAAVFSVYVLTPPAPIPMTVSDGSTTDVLEGNFWNYTSNFPLVRDFNTTTWANQSDHSMSALTLRLHSVTFFVAGNPTEVDVLIEAAVQGAFASNLHLSSLTVTLNETGQYIHGVAFGVSSPATVDAVYPPVNVSFGSGSSNPTVYLEGSDAASLTPTFSNETGQGPLYWFTYPVFFDVSEVKGYDHFVGLRATVTGDFTPNVSVGIALDVIDAGS